MIVRERMDHLRERVNSAESTDVLHDVISEINRLEPEWSDSEHLDAIRLDAFDTLSELTSEDVEAAQEAIRRYLLPLCLRTTAEWPNNIGWRYSELLSKWLNRFPITKRFGLRYTLLTSLIEFLSGPRSERACRLIGMIGYRSELLAKRLTTIMGSHDGELGDVALRSLTCLGIPENRKEAYLQNWISRAKKRWSHDLISVAGALQMPECVGLVFDQWLTAGNLASTEGDAMLRCQLTTRIPALVADRFAGDPELQDSIWERFSALDKASPALTLMLLANTEVTHRCDTPGVVRYYLSLFSSKNRDILYDRLQDFERPRQLLGWECPPTRETLDIILSDALSPTAMQGRFMTQDLRRKVHAWQTMFSLGRGDALENISDAIKGEANGYSVGAVIELAACFRVDPLPLLVRDFVAGDFHDIADDEGERVSAHIAAIALAHASESRAAFDALLDFNLIRQGGVLISLLNALADNAKALVQTGDETAVEALWQATRQGQPQHRRDAACAVLGRLIRDGVLPPSPPGRVKDLLQDETIDPYARRVVLEALGHTGSHSLSEEIMEFIRSLARIVPVRDSASHVQRQDSTFRALAVSVLARHGLVANDPELLQQCAGLIFQGDTWHLNEKEPPPASATLLGLLYADKPNEFASAVADLVRVGDWAAVVQLAPFLQRGPRPLPQQIADEFTTRIRRAGPTFGEPELLPLLAMLAPSRLISESWSEIFSWPPQVRAALARSLALTPSEVSTPQRMDLLLLLMGDSQYGVRRSAYRAAARVAPADLLSLCGLWASLTEANVQAGERPFIVDMRRRAAEAAAWLEILPSEGGIADLAYDPEPEVRETFARCSQERRRRDWARLYLDHVLAIRDEESLLRCWRYGRALGRIGDDDVLERLEQHRREADLRPGIRYWLGRLIKKLRSHWDEVTHSWPEPWFARRGRLECQ